MNKETAYITLNNQILAYEKYAFERTMLIGFIGFPCLGILDNGFFYWIPFFIMLLLILNLSYTIANLKKAMRLKIYIQTVLEGSKTYVSLSNFLILKEHYKKTNSKEIAAIEKEFNHIKDITNDKSLTRQTIEITAIFLILYFTITIIIMNSDSSYERNGMGAILAMPLSGGLLAILTFIIGILNLLVIEGVSVVTEKKIAEKVLEAM